MNRGPGLFIRRHPLMLCIPLTALLLLGGCQSCWQVDNSCGSANWGCESGADFDCGGDAEAALVVGAIYLAIAIPYLIAEACRSCP